MKILVADDDKALSRLAEAILRDSGHTVVTAADASQILPMAQRERPDLILLDINMPGGNGSDMLLRLKRGALTSSIQVIVVSGVADPQVHAAAVKEGAEGFLQKPWSPESLVRELQKLAPRLPW